MRQRRRACRGANRRTEAARDERAGRGPILGDMIPTDLVASLFPTSMAWKGPRHGSGAEHHERKGLVEQRLRGLPLRRAGNELRPPFGRDLAVLSGRRGARTSFQGAARKASPSSGRGKRPGGVDPAKLLGAVFALTPDEKVAAQSSSGVPGVPVVTTRRSEKNF